MKKYPILLLSIFFIAGCNSFAADSELPMEMTAFNSLSESEQDLIPVSPKDATVKKEKVFDKAEVIIDKNYADEELYWVVFNHTETETAGNLFVLVGTDHKSIVGKGYLKKE